MSNNKNVINIRKGFSDRNGIKFFDKTIQIFDFNLTTRNHLWNGLSDCFDAINWLSHDQKNELANVFRSELFGEAYSDSFHVYSETLDRISHVVIENSYDDVLTTIEYIVNFFLENIRLDFNIISHFNEIFENDFAGYKFVDKIIVRISNEEEKETIEKAINETIDHVSESFKKALSYISEKQKDYENSIKESVNALEAFCNDILNTKGKTLGDSIKEIEKKLNIHPTLKDAISKLYGFASDQPGIRHNTGKEKYDVGFDEAKYVLVICTSFVNYLQGKKANTN